VLEGRTPAPEPAFAEYWGEDERHLLVSLGRWALLRTGDREALYDVEADPGETTDLAAARPEERTRLHALAEAYQPGGASPVEVDAATTQWLRELGYVE